MLVFPSPNTYIERQHTKDKNDPSSSHTSQHHCNDARDPASNSHTPYTTSAAHPARTQTHLSNRTLPSLDYRRLYANSQPSSAPCPSSPSPSPSCFPSLHFQHHIPALLFDSSAQLHFSGASGTDEIDGWDSWLGGGLKARTPGQGSR
jgi:hypothetical protein